MSEYKAPVRDINFVLNELVELPEIAKLPGFEEATPDLVEAVIEEASKLAGELVAPTNYPSNEQGSYIKEGEVVVADGLSDAYQALVEGAWISLPFDPEWGGQGLPSVLAQGVQEMLMSANLGFSLCPMLTYGAIEAIAVHGSDELKNTYLSKMVSGEWTGTMNLTESQAGTDLAAIRCKAEPKDDHYLITGQKIFITWGDHNLTDNVIHLVLAKLPDAPEGVKGISLFLVPKYLPTADGQQGERNDVSPVSVENKMGIHSSPTCVMSYGDNGGAVGHLVGEAHKGLAGMFTMMNHARLTVGLQGVAVAERAYQQAVAYAGERIQGAVPEGSESKAIISHPDVRRMLMLMKSLTEASRAIAYVAMGSYDYLHKLSGDKRDYHLERVDLLTPIVKGWCTEIAVEVASLGVQVHGGMGYIEETGAAQHYRDARILPIYEGTNGIQALDLVGRKFLRDGGKALAVLLEEIAETEQELASSSDQVKGLLKPLQEGRLAWQHAAEWIAKNVDEQGITPGAVAFDFMMLAGVVCGGWMMAKAALASAKGDSANDFNSAKIATAKFYLDYVMPRHRAHLQAVLAGADATMELKNHQFCL